MQKRQCAANDEQTSNGDARQTSEVLVKSKTLVWAGRHRILEGVSLGSPICLRASAKFGGKGDLSLIRGGL